MSRRCWTCNTDHDLDAVCATSMRSRTVTAAGGRLADENSESRFGPVIVARWNSDDACCGEGIEEGDRIRSDGDGGWTHEGCEDE